MSIAATVGLPIITAIPACIHDGFVALEDLKGVDQTYFLYSLKALEGELKLAGQIGSQANVNTGIVKALTIPLPPGPEQRAIADALFDADRSIVALERLIVKRQAIKQGMIQQLMTGETRLPGFTASWVEGTFAELAVPSRERVMPRNAPSATPLVELEHIEGRSGRLIGVSRASDAVSLKAVFNPGDVLFGKLRAYLRKFWYADVRGLCTTEIWVLHPKAGVHGQFVRYIVETDGFIDAASGAYGTHMPRSDWNAVRDLPVRIPSHDEQAAIASVLADADAEIDALHRRLAKAKVIKQGMMQELLTGRTRLPVQEVAA
jgi:type I restriction enzyme S subunit